MYPVEVRLASYLLSVSFDETDPHFNGKLSAVSLLDAANLKNMRPHRCLKQYERKTNTRKWRDNVEKLPNFII